MTPNYPNAHHQARVGWRHDTGPLSLPSNQQRHSADRLLTDAIRHGQPHDMLRLINEAVAAGADLQCCPVTHRYRIEAAILANNLAAVQTLLAKGAAFPQIGAQGKDLLMLAAEQGSADIVEHLLKTKEIDARYTDHFGQTALMYAVRHGNPAAVTALLQHDADVDAATFHDAHHHGAAIFGFDTDYSGEDVTPLMIAVALRDRPMLTLLLKFDAEIECGTHDSPLSLAAQTGQLDILQCLLAHHPVTSRHDSKGLTPLHIAIKANASLPCIAALLAQTEIEVRTDTHANLTPLGLAITLQNVEVAAMLLQKNASLPTLSHPGVTAWQLLPSQASLQPAMIDLLVLASGPSAFHTFGDLEKLLERRIASGSCVQHPSQYGLFTQLAAAIEPLLLAVLHETSGSGHPAPHAMQLHMRLAHAIVHADALRALATAAHVEPGPADSPAVAREMRITNATAAQAVQLTSAAQQRLLTGCLAVLSDPAVAHQSQLSRADQASDFTVAELARHLQQDSGLPAALATQIAQCKDDALRVSVALFGAGGNRAEQQRYRQKLLSLLLTSDLLPGKSAVHGSFDALLADTLISGAANATAAVHAFLADPPKLLRATEQRHSLRDVNTGALAIALCVQTGLPPDCGAAVAEAWAAGVAAVKKMPGVSNPAQLHAALSAQFARALSQRLPTIPPAESAHLQALQAKVMTALSAWCGRHQPPGSAPAHSAVSDRNSSATKRANPDHPEPILASKRERN